VSEYSDNSSLNRAGNASGQPFAGTGRNVPDIAQCFRYMDKYAMLPNIRRHSIIVARVAWQIVEELNTSELATASVSDQEFVIAGALLHDIAKTPCLKKDCDHAQTGAEICNRLGYPEIACIVAEHVILKDYDISRYRQGIFTAREVIYYADKRVRHEEIVSLDDRLEYILENYGMGDQVLHGLIKENFDKCVQLEQYFFSFLPFPPDLLAEKVLGSPPDVELQTFFEESKGG